jgi:methionyl-tRNA formyltransferase
VFHDSLLPKYRGFSPTVWAIVNGESQTGATLFEIGEEIDSGNIVDQRAVPIRKDDTIANVMEGVTQAYLDILKHNIHSLLNGSAARTPQDHSLATYTCRRLPQDNLIHWDHSTAEIYNLIRAVTYPYSGAFTYLNGRKLRIWSAEQIPEARYYVVRAPGRVVEIYPEKGSVVLTGNGSLLITKVQTETGEPVCAAEILNSIRHNLG